MARSTGHRGPARSDCTCFNLRRATRLVTQLYDDALRPAGIRNTQFTVLQVLRERGVQLVSELAEALVTDRTTLARNLKPLERDGLIAIRPGADPRAREVSITRKGDRVLDRAYPLWQNVQRQVRRKLGGAQVSDLVSGLQATVEELRRG